MWNNIAKPPRTTFVATKERKTSRFYAPAEIQAIFFVRELFGKYFDSAQVRQNKSVHFYSGARALSSRMLTKQGHNISE